MRKIKIIEATIELGLGGTEYVIQLYSKYFDKDRFEVLVVGLNAGGERARLIQEMGIEVQILDGNLNKLAQLLKETDVFHWHGNGTMGKELAAVLRANKPKLVIQTNVFGLYNASLYDIIDYDLYVSKMILIRRMMQDQYLNNNFFIKRKVLSNPVDTDQIINLLPTEIAVQQFKKENKLEDYFIVGRIGRADGAKFDLITLDGFARFASRVSNARFLLVGATLAILEYAEKLGITNKLIVFENTPDLKQLLIYYKTIDIFLAASNLGESFGLVIAEAMTAGVPVVTITTPDRDNAQVELVDNGKTGLVVKRDSEKIAAALFYLYQNKDVREKLSEAAKLKVIKEYRANRVVNILENLIYKHFKIQVQRPEDFPLTDLSPTIIDDYYNRCYDLWESEAN